MKFESNKISLCVVSVYRLPSTNAIQFVDELPDVINLVNKGEVRVFAGDINIDVSEPNDSITNKYLNIMADNCFLSYINKPTRVTATSETTLDHVFVRRPTKHNLLFTPVIIQCDVTDHFATVLQIREDCRVPSDINKAKQTSKSAYFTIIDYNRLRNDLLLETWDSVYNIHNRRQSQILLLTTLLKNSMITSTYPKN